MEWHPLCVENCEEYTQLLYANDYGLPVPVKNMLHDSQCEVQCVVANGHTLVIVRERLRKGERDAREEDRYRHVDKFPRIHERI